MICKNCQREIGYSAVCPHCHTRNILDPMPHHLPAGTVIGGRYTVLGVLGEGGFGITYLGRNNRLEHTIAIKEYYPHGVSHRNSVSNDIYLGPDISEKSYEHGKASFLKEAKTLAKFTHEPGIVDVTDFVEENNTAYLIMEYLDGVTLKEYLRRHGRLEPKEAFKLLMPIINALEKIHAMGVIHRDISPDNIMILRDGQPKLMDFGSARVYVETISTMSIMLKKGYAPEEQYHRNGDQGPWTDVYGLCATVYHCITGKTPDEALDRLNVDRLKEPSELGAPITPELESVLMYGLAVYKEDRCENMTELKRLLEYAFRFNYVPREVIKSGSDQADTADNKKGTAEENEPATRIVPSKEPEFTGSQTQPETDKSIGEGNEEPEGSDTDAEDTPAEPKEASKEPKPNDLTRVPEGMTGSDMQPEAPSDSGEDEASSVPLTYADNFTGVVMTKGKYTYKEPGGRKKAFIFFAFILAFVVVLMMIVFDFGTKDIKYTSSIETDKTEQPATQAATAAPTEPPPTEPPVSSFTVSESGSTANAFQKTIDYLFANYDFSYYHFPSEYRPDGYTVNDSGTYFSTVFRHGNNVRYDLSKTITAEGQTITLDQTTLSDLLNNGWKYSFGQSAPKANYSSSQTVKMSHKLRTATFYIDKTESDPTAAKVISVLLDGPAGNLLLPAEFSYMNITSSDDVQKVISEIGAPYEYAVTASSSGKGLITMKFADINLETALTIEYQYDPAAGNCRMRSLRLNTYD